MRNNLEKIADQKGFTLAEILVSTAVFSIIISFVFGIYYYILVINRRVDALRQGTQASRNFVEFLTREIRNGKLVYESEFFEKTQFRYTTNGIADYLPSDCQNKTYSASSICLKLLNLNGELEAIYAIKDTGNTKHPEYANVYLIKSGLPPEKITPDNVYVDFNSFNFLVRPGKDPYIKDVSTGYPATQPSVTFSVKFIVDLPSGENVAIPYETSVSSDKYDIQGN